MGEMKNDGAPVVQILLTLSFEPSLTDLTVLDLAELAHLYRAEFPIFQQLVRAGPMTLASDEQQPNLTGLMGLPRIAMSTSDSREHVYLQNDRLSYGWTRTTPLGSAHDYPGFTAVKTKLFELINRVQSWAAEREIAIEPSIGEIIYTDAFLLRSGQRLSDFYTLFAPTGTFTVDEVEHAWEASWPSDSDRKGVTSGKIQAPALSPEGDPVTTLEAIVRFEITGDWNVCDAAFVEGHGVVTDVYERLVKPEVRVKSAG
jgi:uncharacterized protein (TIGR04255 family)